MTLTDLSNVKFFQTSPHPCSYLDDKKAITLFADPHSDIDLPLYDKLTNMGFRRSGAYLYRPNCNHCKACVATRLPVAEFQPKRRHRRVLKANQSLSVSIVEPSFSQEHYDLYQRYISQHHADGDMYPPSPEQYQSFLISPWSKTKFVEFRMDSVLLAVAVMDYLQDGLSAIYTYFDPDYSKLGLGNYAVLWQIKQAQKSGLTYLYLGYWIKQCRKMSYKTQFRPAELYINQQWLRLR